MALRVNLGCGPVYAEGPEWINLDFSPTSTSVRQANLLETLPIDSNSCQVVYSSHFFEHIPRDKVPFFLGECIRILHPGGVLRLVLPDFQEMCREYLTQRECGDHEKADFLVIEIIDQCIRMQGGGELGRVYQRYQEEPVVNLRMRQYLKERNGENLATPAFSHPLSDPNKKRFGRFIFSVPGRLKNRLQREWFKWNISQLPKVFVEQNISFAAIGERHHWLWDYQQLSEELEAAGFQRCKLYTHNQSQINDFPFFPLDTDGDGLPRKGRESMFVEAVKP
jgi:predicted SAM-dependent methyltransferase